MTAARKCGRTVLVVEDDRDVREAIAEVLVDCDYKPMHASNGAEALERLRSAPVRPCVILLDVMMPVMDGREFLARQREDALLKQIPVVVLSAHADGARSAAQLNVAGFLKKPVDLSELLRVVEKFCGKA
jgi:two-component system, chemotaxis family, chemotaxis protein CheY